MLAHLRIWRVWFDEPRNDEPMTAACNVVQPERSHSVDDHDVDTAVFVRFHKGALQVLLPVVERTWASKPRWVGIWRVGIVESDELL